VPRSIETLRDWLEENPPDPARFTQTAAGVARRALTGEDFFIAVRELLDELALLREDALRARALSEEPPPTGDARQDAYLAALAEHVATQSGLAPPSWTAGPSRFLERFWFVSSVEGFRAIAIAQSPAAFRRRGVFIARSSLERR
jgi:hypothetical protein